MIFEGISGRNPDPSRGFQPGPAPRRGDSGGTGGGRGGVAEARYHLDRGWQPWPTRSTSSFQEGEGPQRVGGLAPNAVMPRALLCVRAGPRGEAAPSHPRRALAGGEVVLSRDRGCCEAWKVEAEFTTTSCTCRHLRASSHCHEQMVAKQRRARGRKRPLCRLVKPKVC